MRKYWGNGFATQAVGLAIGKGFEDLGVERIEAFVDPANIASQRVLEKNGFVKEGLLRNWVVQKKVVRVREEKSPIYRACKSPEAIWFFQLRERDSH